jgi:hypothetical protein
MDLALLVYASNNYRENCKPSSCVILVVEAPTECV